MLCPNCRIPATPDQKLCPGCGLPLPEFSQLLDDKLPTQPKEALVGKRKARRRGLRLWTGAGIIFYLALYWAIISKIIIGKGRVLSGILFLLVITAISVGGLLILYAAALQKRSGYRLSDRRKAKSDTSRQLLASQPREVATSVTEDTTELLERDLPDKDPERSFRED